MKKKFRLYVGFLLMASGVCAMTACSGGEDSIANTTGGGSVSKTDEVLTLTINTGNVSSRATDIKSDPTATKENTINRITVGIFDPGTGAVKSIQELKSGDGSAGSGTFNVTTSGSNAVAVANIVTSALAQNDDVLVAVNAPVGHFSGVTSKSAFAKDLDLSIALTTTGNSSAATSAETSENIPMYGEGALGAPSGSNFTANINVVHLIAKVTLESLTVDFDENGSYKNATFTPTAFFLINVPEKLVFQTSPIWTSTNTNWYHGFATDTGNHGTYKEYLTTSTIVSGQELKGTKASATATFNDKYYLYAMPNSSDVDGTRTKLVIAGQFKADGQTVSNGGKDVYYPVSINATYDAAGNATAPNGTIYKVYPNKNYKCSVIIKTLGSDDPWKSIDPQTAQITVTVTDFEDVNQTTTFK